MANPAHAFALSGANLISFHPASPTVANTIAITNLAAGETLVGIDFRPQNGTLYGLGVNAASFVGDQAGADLDDDATRVAQLVVDRGGSGHPGRRCARAHAARVRRRTGAAGAATSSASGSIGAKRGSTGSSLSAFVD